MIHISIQNTKGFNCFQIHDYSKVLADRSILRQIYIYQF